MKSPESLQVKDVTTRYSSLAILGPYSQQVLAELTRTSLETTDFDVGQSKVGWYRCLGRTFSSLQSEEETTPHNKRETKYVLRYI